MLLRNQISGMSSDYSSLDRFCTVRRQAADAPAVLAIAAHPDDETIGMGAQFWRLNNCNVMHITDGAPLNGQDARAAGYKTRLEYAEARRTEAINALSLAGIPLTRVRCLGIADQESSYQLRLITERVAAVIEELEPDIVVTHPYEGGHPDHDATAFAVHAALQLIDPDHARTALLEFTSYHFRDGCFETYNFLQSGSLERTITLSAAERSLKHKMLSYYATQQSMLAAFPISIERFRIAPCYDFCNAPHHGALCYDEHAWGISSSQWQALAAESMACLKLVGSF